MRVSFRKRSVAPPLRAQAAGAALVVRIRHRGDRQRDRGAPWQPGLQVRLSNLSGGPESIRDRTGALSAPAPGRSTEAIVRGFLQQNGDLYGLSAADQADLVVLGDSPGGASGLRMLRLEQQIDGRPVFQSETRFVVDRRPADQSVG
jgi:hypothetical protein